MLQLCVNDGRWFTSYESQSDKGRARETTRLLLLDDTSDMYNTKGRDGAEVKLGWVGLHAGVGW